jgi:protein kinase-like protein
MELIWTHDKWNYQITVKGQDNHQNVVTKVYKTIDIIANTSKNLRGRATRVYEAYEVGNPGSIVAIKDSWVDSNRPKEGDTLSKLLDDASDDEKAKFLTVLIHRVVMIDGREDLTQDLVMNGYLVSTDRPETNDESENSGIDELEEIMADVDIDDHGSVGDTTQTQGDRNPWSP